MSAPTVNAMERYDRDNLAVAKQVLVNPEAHPVLTVTWARLVLARLGTGDDKGKPAQAVLAFDEVMR